MNGLLEEREKQNLLIRIALHRICAIITIIIVFLCILFVDMEAKFAMGVLIVLALLEGYWWRFYYLSPKVRQKSVVSNKLQKKFLLRFIENNFDLKYTGSQYPWVPLLVEAIVLTILCIISGSIYSPFFPLFAIFSALGLYVLDRRTLLLAATDVFFICFCFVVIVWGEKLVGNYLIDLGLTTKSLQASSPWISLVIVIYSVAMSGMAFYNVAAHYSEQEEESFERPFRETQEFLNTRQIPYHQPYENKRIFVIGDKSLNPEGTLALLPYCSRGSHCPIRLEDEKKPVEIPTTTDGCQHCERQCHIGRVFDLKGSKIAEVRVIGSSHNIDDVVDDFCKNDRQLTHVIAVCCTSNLARYLQRGMNKYEGVTVIYTPLVPGDKICVSSIDPTFDGRTLGPLPCTSFDSSALIRYLDQL